MVRARHPVRGDPDDHPRRHDRDRRAARDPGRPRVHPGQPELGHGLLPDRVRRPAAAQRPAGGPARPQAHVPGRPGRVHPRLAGLRAGRRPRDADRRPVRAGHRRRDGVVGHAGHDRPAVQPARRAATGDRRVLLRRRGRRLGRPDRWRPARAAGELALDLLRERADRPARRDRRLAAAGRGPGHGAAHRGGRARRGRSHRRRHARRLRHRPARGLVGRFRRG